MSSHRVPLCVLDLVPIPSGAGAADALRNTIDLAQRAEDLGYRRYEWKCDALNASSRRAAERLGFAHEGTFRHAHVVKGRNRDTAWYAIVDSEWPRVRDAFRAWLDPGNFDADGRQRRGLAELRGETG